MNRHAEQFIQDVDNILQNAPSGESEQWTETYQREMAIVQALAATDFSQESQVRQTLKQQLHAAHVGRKEHPMKTQLIPRPFARLAIAGLVMIFLLLAISPLGASLAQSLVQIMQNWQLGENTTAVSVDGDFEAVPDEYGETIILPAPELPANSDEIVPDEEGAEQVRQITLDPTISFDEAQTKVTFRLQQPTFVPEGYELQGVVMIDSGQASLDYMNIEKGRLMGLLQTAVGGSNGNVQVTFTSDMEVVDTAVNGNEALWTQSGDEGLLIWESEGVNYQLVGLSDLELALKVAESLE